MSGRHRKPSSTGRTVAKVAVTGAIIGVSGVAFSGTANAAPDSDWDRLAQCESGGNWAINTGNGFQGGLQFSPSTWNAHGGNQYAATANQASREQQITVAERVLASQGWGAWPACSSSLGLTSGPTKRDVPATKPQTTPKQETRPEAPATPPLPDLTSGIPSTSGTSPYVGIVDNALEAAKAQGIQIDPQIVQLINANKGLLPR